MNNALKFVAIPGAILATIGVAAAIGFEKPWPDKLMVVQLEQKSVDAFNNIQQQTNDYRRDSSQSWCELYRRQAAELQIVVAEMPGDPYLLSELSWATEQREYWCSQVRP
jgi:hypothetical protein